MHDQQAPASKPLSLNPKPSGITPPKSPAALQGAVSAFLPKPVIPTVNVSSTSVGARIAAFTAGTQAQQRSVARSPERQYGSTESSPTRGRQLPSNLSLSPRAAEAPTLLSTSEPSSRPLLQVRSSSTLAAQHASAQSRSPRHSPNRSLRSSTTSSPPVKDDERGKQNTDALSGATASMAANPVRKQASIEPVQSVRSMVLNFEKTPVLPAIQKSHGTANDNSLLTEGLIDGANGFSIPSLPPNPTATGQTHLQDVTRMPLILGENATKTADHSPPLAFIAGSTPGYERAYKLFPDSGPVLRRGRSFSHKHVHRDSHRDTMTVNDLANAMVASTLASSRAASPSKKAPPPPPPPPRKRSLSIPVFYETRFARDQETRKKPEKPRRAMKQTLRKQGSSSDETPELIKRGRRHWMRKHPNMHSEGDRKRWRDKITTRERRRYEGVFAANRGLLIGLGYFEPSPNTLSDNLAEGNQVVNIIVRDIWERSRLPREVLKEIYDLVSPEEAHTLNREQFVVGLWLIDQRLKGRKLPVKVSASVWSSVRHSEGIKIRSRRYS